MSLSCDIVMDLAGVYHDGIASAESCAAIEEHLKNCKECRRFYRHYKIMLENRRRNDLRESAGAGDFSALASRLRQRRAIITSILIGYSCIVGGILVLDLIRGRRKGRQ
jgi:predicted anti-sigma-YlaC factor YlaD